MPQLPISVSSSQPSPANSGQQTAAAAFSAEGCDCLAGQGQDFGSILGMQMKGVANALLEQLEKTKADELSTLAEVVEQPAAAASAAIFQVDFAALTAAPLAPPIMLQGTVREEAASARKDAEEPVLDLTHAGKTTQPAEIAGNGRNLPQSVSDEKLFADKLATLVEPSSVKRDALPVTDPQLSARSLEGAVVAAVPTRQVEQLPAVQVAPAVGSAAWGGAVGEKVVWMVTQNHQVAELHLNPPSLGPLEVRLTVSNDQATALFVSHHSAVREAIETAMPRLREMLADNGIMLGNATVSSESFGQQQAFEREANEERNGVRGGEVIAGPLGGEGRVLGVSRNGMVDIFA